MAGLDRGVKKLLRWLGVAALGLALLVLAGSFARAWLVAPTGRLEAWHSDVPPDLTAAAIDRGDWAGYVAFEDQLFDAVAAAVTRRPAPGQAAPFNRYAIGSAVWPGRFARDWNRSFVLEPAGEHAGNPVGAVVLLHGLSDAPYSLRQLALRYRARGWLAIGVRLPGHGTAPGALTAVDWRDWTAATRLAMREARRRVGTRPIELVGYSNGGALAVEHQLAALSDRALPRARRLILLSPMVGLTEFARFAGIAAWPAVFPAFAKAAWLDIVPEYNPFKYNSFPVNAARQSYRLTAALQDRLRAAASDGSIRRLPPILTFQSIADATVSAPAVVSGLYDLLPANGSELVVFDINRAGTMNPLLRPAMVGRLATMLPVRKRRYRLTVIGNRDRSTTEVVERSITAGALVAQPRELKLRFPPQVFSLTHVAMPFPAQDGLYGGNPDPGDDFGIRIGTLAVRGERGILAVNLETLLRLTWNPFFPYMAERIERG